MTEPAVRVRGLTKRYGDVLAVDGLDLDVARGATAALLGGNGAGKTTTIAMILGLLLPSAGEVRVLGHDMARDRHRALARMNFSSPYVDLPKRLTVAENLTVYALLYGVPERRARIAARRAPAACRSRRGNNPLAAGIAGPASRSQVENVTRITARSARARAGCGGKEKAMDAWTISTRLARLATAALLALGATAVPPTLDLGPKAAMADKGGGKGNAGGGQGHGNGMGKGGAPSSGSDNDADSDGIASAADLGRLNAAHASETALANAAPNSAVGEVAAYRDAVLAGETEDAAVAVDAAANKTVTESVLHALNELLGIDHATVDAQTGASVHDTEGEVAGLAGGE